MCGYFMIMFLNFSIVLHTLLTLLFQELYQLMYPIVLQALVNSLFWHPFLKFRQSYKTFFEKSDLFFICMMHPLSFDIQKQDLEIEAAQVWPIFVAHYFLDSLTRPELRVCISVPPLFTELIHVGLPFIFYKVKQ